MKEKMTEKLRDNDINMRDAIGRKEHGLPLMPADLNARLMERAGHETGTDRSRTRMIWPWIAAASVAAVITVLLTPPKQSDAGADTSGTLTAQVPEVQPGPVESQTEELQATDNQSAEPLIVEDRNPEPEQKNIATEQSRPAAVFTEVQQTAVPDNLLALESSEADDFEADASLPVDSGYVLSIIPEEFLALNEMLNREPEPAVLTESDLPVTNPENLKHTEEELAILQEKANEAYLKWWEFELEIANYYLDKQTAKNIEL